MNEYDHLSFPARETGRVAITNVTVVPMDTDRTVPDQTVVIEGGTIVSLGAASQVPVGGARVVDGRGKYLMPGLADMHVHYWDIREFGMFLANGVTLVRNMWGSPFHLALQAKLREGAFPGPQVVTTSPIIDGPGVDGNTIWPGSALAADPAQAASLVREFAARGYQQTKAYSWLKLDVLRALGEASREAGIRMVGHCPEGITYEEAIDAGMTCFEHLTGITHGHMRGASLAGMRMGSMDALRTVVENTDLDAIRRLAHLLAERSIWNCSTLVVWQGTSQEQAVAMANPLLEYEPATMAAGWDPANDFRFRATTTSRAEWLVVARARIDLYVRIISILHEEGAPLLLGTDTPNPFVYQGFAIHEELANYRQAGLSPYEALRSGTADAAQFVGEEDTWGTIASGKRADLLLLAANPLEDVAAVQHPEAVFVNGYVFLRDDLDALLAQRKASVSTDAGSAPVHLAPAGGEGDIVAEGLLTEQLSGLAAGSVQYRHTRRGDGTWLIEETRRSEADSLSSWGGSMHARVELSRTLDVIRAELRNESFLGTESYDIRSEEDGSYEVRCTEIDGFVTTSRLSGPLPPGEDLSVTALPLLLKERPPTETTLHVPGIDGANSLPIPLTLTPPAGEGDAQYQWQVHVTRNGTSSDQTYRLAPDGTFLSMAEQTWRGAREVTPAETTT